MLNPSPLPPKLPNHPSAAAVPTRMLPVPEATAPAICQPLSADSPGENGLPPSAFLTSILQTRGGISSRVHVALEQRSLRIELGAPTKETWMVIGVSLRMCTRGILEKIKHRL